MLLLLLLLLFLRCLLGLQWLLVLGFLGFLRVLLCILLLFLVVERDILGDGNGPADFQTALSDSLCLPAGALEQRRRRGRRTHIGDDEAFSLKHGEKMRRRRDKVKDVESGGFRAGRFWKLRSRGYDRDDLVQIEASGNNHRHHSCQWRHIRKRAADESTPGRQARQMHNGA